MKKILYLFSAAAIIFAACTKTETSEQGGNNGGNSEYPDPAPNTAYELQGGMEGTVWEEGSVLGLYLSMSQNLECPIDPSTVGQATGKFTTPAITLNKGENSLFVYSPYSAELVYYGGSIYGVSIAESQIQTRPDVMPKGFCYGTAVGVPGSGNPFTFTLQSVAAIAEVKVSSTELAGFSVESVTVSSSEESANFGGTFTINTATNEMEATETFKKVGVTIANPSPLSTSAQSFYVQLLPEDYTSTSLYFNIKLTKEGETDRNIPISISGLNFEAGKITEVNCSDIKSSDAAEWYVTEDSRKFTGLGYAYGEANTFLIQCKSGSTYNGAAYSPNSSIPDEVSIDIRPRGDISKVVDPKGATFEWYCASGTTPYVCRNHDYTQSQVDPKGFSFSYDGEYTVKVKNNSAYAGSPILLMKKDGKVLWAWTFWNIAADGTQLQEIPVGNFKLANMEIGQATTNFDQWTANKSTGGNVDPVFRTVHFYQFGRPIPTFWTTYWSLIWPQQAAGNVPAIEGPITLEEAIANPVGQILNPIKEAGLGNWCSETVQDIWGGSGEGENEFVGTKTVYDPCPKGWKVPHPEIFETLANSTMAVKDQSGAVGVEFSAASGTRFISNGYGNGKTGNTSDWRLATMGGGSTAVKGACSHAILWTNMGGATSGTVMQIDLTSNKCTLNTMDRANSGPVRCMKDPDAK